MHNSSLELDVDRVSRVGDVPLSSRKLLAAHNNKYDKYRRIWAFQDKICRNYPLYPKSV